MPHKITACITAFNEESNIARCLDSLTWCDEIVVLDSFSSDKTVEISKRYTNRVYQHEWLGYIGQKNLIRGMATHAWVLFLDADEEVSPALKKEIKTALADNHGRYAGYEFPRMVYFLGKWIRHGEWYPDIKLRLFLKERGRSAGKEPHDQVLVDGQIARLTAPIYHYTYDSIEDQLNTMNRFTSITAKQKMGEGKCVHWHDVIIRPMWRFFKAYIIKRGFMDGRRGLLIACITTFTVGIKYCKLWEARNAELFSEPPSTHG